MFVPRTKVSREREGRKEGLVLDEQLNKVEASIRDDTVGYGCESYRLTASQTFLPPPFLLHPPSKAHFRKIYLANDRVNFSIDFFTSTTNKFKGTSRVYLYRRSAKFRVQGIFTRTDNLRPSSTTIRVFRTLTKTSSRVVQISSP